MNHSLNHTHLQRLLFSIIFSAFGLAVFAQSHNDWTNDKVKEIKIDKDNKKITITTTKTTSCEGFLALNEIEILDQQLNNLQNYKSQARSLKRKIRTKKRTLKRKEARLVDKIQGIEDYIRVDE